MEEDEAEQKVDAVDAKIEIEQDLMTKTEMNARIPIDATTATHLGYPFSKLSNKILSSNSLL